MEIYQQSSGRFSSFRKVVGVISAVRVDVDQLEAMIVEDAPVAFATVRKVRECHAVHIVLFALEAIDIAGCEQERGTRLHHARDACNRSNRVLWLEMKYDAPGNGSIEDAIGLKQRVAHTVPDSWCR
jgi:hypothetical protein